jgi:alkylation response protein AidB-like acyl-CoA dehydrogenase
MARRALQALYLDKLVSGGWLGTMCLTEPQAGSDLGLVRTQATVATRRARQRRAGAGVRQQDLHQRRRPRPDRQHRAPGAVPPGRRAAGHQGAEPGLVPKVLPDGTRNAVHCDGIEHKMGIHGSATCQMRFDGADGWLIGEPHRGLAAMFLMMNAARLHVAMQGVGHLEAATQNAWRYARSGCRCVPPPGRPAPPGAGPDPIAWHPAMRRTC